MYSSMYLHSFCCTTCFVQWVEGCLVACMCHYIVDPTRLCDPCTVLYRVCAIKGTTIKFCMSGSQNYIVLPTVGYPTCSDKWRSDK